VSIAKPVFCSGCAEKEGTLWEVNILAQATRCQAQFVKLPAYTMIILFCLDMICPYNPYLYILLHPWRVESPQLSIFLAPLRVYCPVCSLPPDFCQQLGRGCLFLIGHRGLEFERWVPWCLVTLFFYHHEHPQKRVECEPVHSPTDMGIIFHCSGHLTIYVNVEYNHVHPRIVIVWYFSG
jgi:hypothetical protein